MKQRMFYFGTNGCAGHYAFPINSDLPDVKSDDGRVSMMLCLFG
jgi:hypothetical protein